MAMQIIEKHKNLVDLMNEDGLTPLHILANKPHAFKSRTQLGAFDRFIYYCMIFFNFPLYLLAILFLYMFYHFIFSYVQEKQIKGLQIYIHIYCETKKKTHSYCS